MRLLLCSSVALGATTCWATLCTLPRVLLDSAALFDTADCIGPRGRDACTVGCADGYEGSPSTLRCPGPGRELDGAPPSCRPRPRSACAAVLGLPARDGSPYDARDCSAGSREGTCEIRCAVGYIGRPAEVDCRQSLGASPPALPRCELACDASTLPREAWSAAHITDNCSGVMKGQNCSAMCEEAYVGEAVSLECVDDDGSDCTCFRGARPRCRAREACRVPPSQEAGFDFSSCANASGTGESAATCLVACPTGTYGSPSLFHCPRNVSDQERVWTGTLPDCSRCNFTARPSHGDPSVVDTCEATAEGSHCSAACRWAGGGPSGARQELACRRAGPSPAAAPPQCVCFTTDDEPLRCQVADGCVAPEGIPAARAGRYDVRDCAEGGRVGTCTVRCAEGFIGPDAVFNCTGPPYRTAGALPSCQRATEHAACKQVPPVPNATGPNASGVPHLGLAEYQCREGFTVEGTPTGNRSFRLRCVDGYFQGYEAAGCAPAAAQELWPACPVNESMGAEGLDAGACAGVREGGSCAVRCAVGYYQPSPGRFAQVAPAPLELPALLVCRGGRFRGTLPRCVRGAQGGVLDFDVYAVVRGGEGSEPPSNLNVFDLEGLLAHLYTGVLFYQQLLGEDPNLSRDPGTGAWVGQPPRLPSSRDEVDTVVWYRLSVKNPGVIPARYLSNLEFGVFADFARGGAQSADARELFRQAGAVVGVSQQAPGLAEAYLPCSGSAWTAAKCSNPVLVGTPEWRANCRVARSPRADPRYVPAGRFAAFSLPGACPNLPTDQKREGGAANASCTRRGDGGFLSGGLCGDGKAPDGSAECTYALREVARVALDDVTGVTQQDCGSGRCRDLRDFQLHCTDSRLRNGVMIAGSQLRECTEHAVPSEAFNASARSCGNATVGAGQTWSCYDACNGTEASAPLLARRCDARANARRLEALRELLNRSRPEDAGPVESPPVLQDCFERSPQRCRPDVLRGLNYCERDETGLCGFCFVPNTSHFDPARVRNLRRCRADLFSGGGYATAGSPVCPEGQGADLACCRYTGHCPRAWAPRGNWSPCGDGACGEALQTLPMACPLEAELGDCRRDLGDPSGAGFCEPGGGCFAARVCRRTQCPWFPYCGAGAEAAPRGPSTPEAGFCLPSEWGPLDSACAWGSVHRYERCSLYYPWDPAAREDPALLCANASRPPSQMPLLVPTRSRLRNCGRCSFGSGPCQECASDELFDASRGCENREPMLELRIQVSMPSRASGSFQRTGFHELSSAVAEAMGGAGVWAPGDVFLSDAFSTPRESAEPAAAAPPAAAASRRLEDAREAWALLVALRRPPDGPGQNASEQVLGGAVDVAVHLESALDALLGEPVRVSLGGLALYCPGMQRAPSAWSSCREGGLSWLGVLAICAAACCVLAIAATVWVRRRRGQRCLRGAAEREALV